MASAWWNLAIRFMLELAALIGIGLAGWQTFAAPWNWAGAALPPLVAATAWGVFNVQGDPSRSGAAPVKIPGIVRLALEFAVLFGGASGFVIAGFGGIGYTMAALTAVHYALSWDRIGWLLRQ